MNMKKWAGVVACAMCLVGIASVQAAPAGKVVVQDNFDSKANWDWHGDVVNGEFILTAPNQNRYAGTQALLRPPVRLPAPGGQEALRIRFKVTKLTDAAGGNAAAEARLFLVPVPLVNDTFADPYSDPSALTILISANGETDVARIRLFRKTAQPGGGFGIPLYTASMPLSELPLTIDWRLSRESYKLHIEPKGQTVEGARENPDDLGSEWAGDLRFAMRVINVGAGVRSQLRISDFSITTDSFTDKDNIAPTP